MNIAVYSLFRDDEASDKISEYYGRMLQIVKASEHDFRWYLLEGDSEDSTYEKLLELKPDNRFNVYKHDTNRNMLVATDAQYRLETLAKMYNKAIDYIVEDDWADFAWLVESDLIINNHNLPDNLISSMPLDAGVIAPMIWITGNTDVRFYDIWGFRAYPNTFPAIELKETPHKETLQYFPPASPIWYKARFKNELVEVATACACFITKMPYLKAGARCTVEDETAGLQRNIRLMGGKVYLHTKLYVEHPLEPWHRI